MVEELAQAEKEELKAKRKTRFLWVIIAADVLLFGYVVYEIVSLAVALAN